ncbi:MAG: hypothetical protein RLZZ09_3448 [Pseudomonadota bacterium]|jgi:hypothetical protein
MNRRDLLALAISASLTGCVTFNEQMLPKRDAPPPPARGVVEWSVGDVKQLLNGESSPGGLASTQSGVSAFGQGMLNRWKSRELIADYGRAGELKTPPAYRLKLSGQIQESASILGSVATGLSLFLIPSSSTLTYNLKAEFTDLARNQTWTVPIRNGSTTWMQILLFPATPFGWMGASHMIEDTADYLYAELHKQGAFSASTRPPARAGVAPDNVGH